MIENIIKVKDYVTRKILEQLVSIDCKISISTKSKLILRDMDLLKRCRNLTVAMSVNTLDENFKNDMDNASSIKERIYTLQELYKNGINTILFISPIFPGLTDVKAIIEKTKNFIHEYWFENLNLRGNYKKGILSYIEKKHPNLSELYEDIYKKGKKEYWNNLSQDIEEYCREHNIKYINYFYHEKLVKEKIK